jgi:hypothetical protein
MSINTAQDLIIMSMQLGGILGIDESPTNSQLTFALNLLNSMIDSWAGRALLTSAQIQESFPIVAGTGSYTIGVGGVFNTSKPFEIVSAFIRDTNNLDYNVDVVPRNTYASYDDKSIASNAGTPMSLFYDPGQTQQAVQTGTIYLYPIPDSSSSYTLFIISEKAFTEFASLSSVITFPPVYLKALLYNLAAEICIAFGKPISKDVAEEAHEGERIVEQISSRNRKGVAGFSFPGNQFSYNIYSDGYAG